MSFARGERVYIDADSDDEENGNLRSGASPPAQPSTDFVGDIRERAPAEAPAAPSLKATRTGFPAHKKRAPRVSTFKQQKASQVEPRAAASQRAVTTQPSNSAKVEESERRRIDEENRQRIAEMSPEEIEQERKELFEGLNPNLIQRLLARANIDDGSHEQDFDSDLAPANDSTTKAQQSTKKVTFETPEPSSQATSEESPAVSKPKAFKPSQPAQPAPETSPYPNLDPSEYPNIHFPTPPQPPDLDPSSPNFLSDLHTKYFPTLPYDPSTLSWMTPIDPNDTTSPYHPSQRALSASELRFSFRGSLLPPRLAREIPVTKGLHHHSEAPEAAGYTVPELARLSRSQVPSQRCMAYQTLGRILYRLGKGEFGEEGGRQTVDGPAQIARDPNQAADEDEDEEDAGSVMATGLWDCIEEGRALETLMEEAGRERGHLTARTYAQEALWSWRRGGGRKRKAV